MRLGIFGGSFDPIHYGHLILAEQCREQAELDRILFVPTASSPLKTSGPFATDKQRIEMLHLAIAGHPSFTISGIEIERGGTSYTVDTLTQLTQQHPESELFLLIGEDSLRTFDQWRQPKAVCELAIPLVVRRPQADRSSEAVDLTILQPYLSDQRFEQTREQRIDSRLIDISSTEIRSRVASALSIRYLLPRPVQKFIETNQLYAAGD